MRSLNLHQKLRAIESERNREDDQATLSNKCASGVGRIQRGRYSFVIIVARFCPKVARPAIMTKKFVWIGFFVGSTLGNMLPLLWGGVGGIAGIWVDYRWGQSL